MKRSAVIVAAAVLLAAGSVVALQGRQPATASTPATSAASPGERANDAIEPAAAARAPDASGFYAGEAGLTPSERAGREIWYKATAGNARFHTYVFQQRIGILIDWFRVLRADRHDDRFAAWG